MTRPRIDSTARLRATVLARSVVCLGLGLGLAACSQLPADGTTSQDPIFGGVPDTTHDAVMALINQISTTSTSACSGTIIALDGASAIYLTAGHCVVANDGMGHVTTPVKVGDPSEIFIVPGPDWMTNVGNGLYYGVAQVAVHPQYDGSVNSPFDMALVRFLGALPATPTIPVLSAADDKLMAGSTITVVGFGKTETNATNSQRREVDRVIQSITTNQFEYDQTDLKGACQGDSGGPALYNSAAGTRVAGITSFGDPDCTKVGASVRVSPDAAFIQSFIASAPTTLSCGECALASVGPGNACVTQSAACASPSSVCGKYLTCAAGCTTSACISQCRAANSAGSKAYEAIVDCQCGGVCATPCAGNTVCTGLATPTTGAGGSTGALNPSGTDGGVGTGGSSGGSFVCADFNDPRPSCTTCLQTTCCTQAIACAGDGTCSSCLADSSSSACRLNENYVKTTECLATCPGAPCSTVATADAGANPTTGTAGAGGSAGETSAAKSGCSCDVGAGAGHSSGFAALLGLALVVSRARRRR